MLNERERLIFHLCTAMVMSVETGKQKKFDIKKIEEIVTRNRARHLTEEEIKLVKEDMQQDELISKISNINGLSEVVLVAAKSDVDY